MGRRTGVILALIGGGLAGLLAFVLSTPADHVSVIKKVGNCQEYESPTPRQEWSIKATLWSCEFEAGRYSLWVRDSRADDWICKDTLSSPDLVGPDDGRSFCLLPPYPGDGNDLDSLAQLKQELAESYPQLEFTIRPAWQPPEF